MSCPPNRRRSPRRDSRGSHRLRYRTRRREVNPATLEPSKKLGVGVLAAPKSELTIPVIGDQTPTAVQSAAHVVDARLWNVRRDELGNAASRVHRQAPAVTYERGEQTPKGDS